MELLQVSKHSLQFVMNMLLFCNALCSQQSLYTLPVVFFRACIILGKVQSLSLNTQLPKNKAFHHYSFHHRYEHLSEISDQHIITFLNIILFNKCNSIMMIVSGPEPQTPILIVGIPDSLNTMKILYPLIITFSVHIDYTP